VIRYVHDPDEPGASPTFEVVDYDSGRVIDTFVDHGPATRFADRMDGLGLRCYVREA
jgi:hypothetical protein